MPTEENYVSKVEELVILLMHMTEVNSDDYGRVLNKGVIYFNVRGAVRKLRSMGYKITIRYTSKTDWSVKSKEPKEVFVNAYETIQELKKTKKKG